MKDGVGKKNERQTEGWGRQTEGWGKCMNRQTNRQANRQLDKHTETETDTIWVQK